MILRMLAATIACLALASCGRAAATGDPPASPELLSIAYPPSLRPLGEALSACAGALPGVSLTAEERPSSAIDLAQADLALWLGEPPANAPFAALLGYEEFAFVLHPENPIEALSASKLDELLAGEAARWEEIGGEGGEINLWLYPPENEVQEVLSSVFPIERAFASFAFLAPDAEALRQAVSADPAAAGFLPRAWLSEAVKPVYTLERGGKPLREPVLALARAEPRQAARQVLLCLQSGPGQQALSERYLPAETP